VFKPGKHVGYSEVFKPGKHVGYSEVFKPGRLPITYIIRFMS
jgi:hypothetical protein